MKAYSFLFLLLLIAVESSAQTVNRFKDGKVIDSFFNYHPGRKRPHILAHRGGPGPTDTENSIPTFQKISGVLPDVILEMDVRMMRDSTFVLLHDATLDRESNATGAVADWSMSDLKKVLLKTVSGQLTDQHLSTFAQVLAWNQNRYVLALDVKPGTDPVRVMKKVQQHEAENSVFVICYSLADAQRMRASFPTLWLAVGVNGIGDLERLENSNFSTHLIALTPQKLQPASFYERLHKLGIPCSVGTYGPNQLDEKPLSEATAGYHELFRLGGDIVTTDRPREVSTLF